VAGPDQAVRGQPEGFLKETAAAAVKLEGGLEPEKPLWWLIAWCALWHPGDWGTSGLTPPRPVLRSAVSAPGHDPISPRKPLVLARPRICRAAGCFALGSNMCLAELAGRPAAGSLAIPYRHPEAGDDATARWVTPPIWLGLGSPPALRFSPALIRWSWSGVEAGLQRGGWPGPRTLHPTSQHSAAEPQLLRAKRHPVT